MGRGFTVHCESSTLRKFLKEVSGVLKGCLNTCQRSLRTVLRMFRP